MANRIQFPALSLLANYQKHNVVEQSDTSWLNSGWPWFVLADAYRFNATKDSETRTITTYNGDPTVTGAWGGAAASSSFIDYRPVGAGAVETVTVEGRYKVGMDLVTVFGAAFPTSQNVVISWAEVEYDALGDEVARTEKSESFSLSAGATEIESPSWHSLSAPSTSEHTKGLEGPRVAPALRIQGNLSTSRRWKEGFYAYMRPGSPPEVYRSEAATGFLDACGDDAAEDYAGSYVFQDDGSYADQRSEDAVEREYFSEKRGGGWPDAPAISRTEAGKSLAFVCAADGEAKAGEILLELSDPVPTQAIVDHVVANVAPGTASTGLDVYDANGTLAHDYLAPDETVKSRSRAKWRLRVNLEGIVEPEDGETFSVAATLYRINLDDGTITEEEVTASLAYATLTGLAEDASDRETYPAEQEWVWIGNLRGPSTPASVSTSMFHLTAETDALKLA